jgi:hypothetical protein
MSTPTRASDQTEDMMKAKNAGDKLQAALAELSVWKMEVTCEVDGESTLRITIRKHNGTGFIKTLTKDQVIYFSENVTALVNQMAEEIYEMLLKQQIVKFLDEPITKAVQNVVLIASKS